MGSPRLKALELGEAERAALETLAARRRTAQGLALRARIVLACAETGSPRLVGARLDVHPDTVRKWRHRFALDRLDGLRDGPRSGAPRKIGDERIEAVISRTLESLPADGTHWRIRAGWPGRAACRPPRCGESGAPFALQPHRVETFKLSTDPDFVAKVRDVVGLYMAPPDRALVLCVDEKSQIQALDRTQPLLPMRPGQSRTSLARLPTSRHDLAVRGARCCHRAGHRQMLRQAPSRRVPSLPRRGRGACPI